MVESISAPGRGMTVRRRAPSALPLLLLFALDATGPTARADSRYAVKLTVYDQLVLPGQPIPFGAKLEHDGIAGLNPDMRGYPLRFTIPSLFDQEVETQRDGVAACSLRSTHVRRSPSEVTVRFAGSRLHRPAEVTGRIFVWPADSPILVIDIDHTISDLREIDVVFTENARIPALPGAVETLTTLSRRYRIIYLTARDHALYNKTRAWLVGRGFPEGPLFTRDFHLWETRGTFKRQFIASLKTRFPNVAVGVGDCLDDARAYLDNGLKALIIDPAGTGRFPGQVLVVPSWPEIGALLGPQERDAPGPRVPRARRAIDPPRQVAGPRSDAPHPR